MGVGDPRGVRRSDRRGSILHAAGQLSKPGAPRYDGGSDRQPSPSASRTHSDRPPSAPAPSAATRRTMLNIELKDYVTARILPNVQTPAQYIGGELHSIRKDHRECRGTVCLAFPDTYSMGMSHHGLQVLYSLMNDAGWACERAFTPLPDFEAALREHGLPLYSLETFTPLGEFDVLGFTLQYEICYTNVLTMLDLGGIPLHAEDRGPDDTLVIAGGPGGQNPELIAPFIDLFVLGDGEPSLPHVCEQWKPMQGSGLSRAGEAGEDRRRGRLGLRPPLLSADLRRRRPPGRDRPDPRRRARADPPVRLDGPRRHPPARPADRPVRRRRRTTGSPSRSCAAAPGSAGSARARPSSGRSGTGRSRRSSIRPWKLQEHRLRRDQPAVALDQRLPQVRGAGDADERGLHAAGGQDLAAEPADHRDAQEDPGARSRRAAGAA